MRRRGRDDKSCGKTVLRVAFSIDNREPGGLRGRLELAAEARPYAIEVNYYEAANGRGAKLYISGNTGDRYDAWRRNYPFREMLISTGEAQCRPDPSVS